MDDDSARRQKLFEGAAFVAFGIGFELLFSFFAKVSVARYLGTADFGSFSIGFALITVATIVCTVGLPDGVARSIPRSESTVDEMSTIVTGVLVSVIASLLIMTLIYLFAEPVVAYSSQKPRLANVIRISALGIPLLVLSNIAVGIGRGYQKASLKVIITNVLRPATFFAGTVVVLVFGIDSIRATYILPVSYIPGALFGIYYILKNIKLRSFLRSLSFRYELLIFSAPLMISSFMKQIMNRLDTFIIAVFEPAAQVGIYNAVYPLSRLSSVFLAAFGFIVMPIFSSIDSDSTDSDINSIYVFTTKWIVVGSVPIFIIFSFLPAEVVSLIYGVEYISGSVVLPVLTIGFFAHTILGPNANALIALGKSRTILLFTIASAISNIALNILLIPPYGIRGAAVATAISYTLLNILYSAKLYQLERVVPINRTAGLLIVATVVIAAIITSGLSRLALSPLLTLIAFGLSFVPLYLALLSLTGSVTSEDISELISLVQSKN